MYKINGILLLLFTALSVGCSWEGSKLNDQLVRFPYKSYYENENKNAFVYLPGDYDQESECRWPVILFLHGNGERGNAGEELDFVLMHGPVYEAWIQKKNLPFVIVSPQLPMFGMDEERDYLKNRDSSIIPRRLIDGKPDRFPDFVAQDPMKGTEQYGELNYDVPDRGWEERMEDVVLILKSVTEKYNVDPDRVYLTGLSYGGFGTWFIASKYPELFAAIAPVVGWGHPDWMEPIARSKIPVWAFAGGRDSTVEKKYFYEGLNKLEELGHSNVRFTIHEDMGHDAWKRIYAGDDIYNWFLSNIKSK